MSDIKIYEKPTCTTCRNLFALLKERGVDVDKIDYHVLGLTRAQVEEIVEKTGLTPRELLRTREPEYKELGLADPTTSDDAIIEAMAEHPALLQRPVVVRGEKAVLARPIERVLELL
ncbi:arsenate reductase (glutaredoxin) [Nocardioides sp. Kera G14]|uniref:arsenate reductase (glutaredoxin) n=1 Tax=Nocardioides sp. Kera G14 TaxID=2884264 RepID=UPI001D11E9B6|nr:arsenate reductase (glutaredoxin) [Nocardioides sp. Kera G14]UDY24116.1 arsenate reductase (glutaredoxin) [Nocardioides sp. Kera G14]